MNLFPILSSGIESVLVLWSEVSCSFGLVVCSQVFILHKVLKLLSLRAFVAGITRINLATYYPL